MAFGVTVHLLSAAALGLVVSLGLGPIAAKAADLSVPAVTKPAVDEANAKIEGFGGWGDGRIGRSGDFSGGALGSVTVPVGTAFGVQIDGLAAVQNGDFVGGGAGHVFTRDPDSYLLGAYGSATGFANRAGAWNGKIGAEGEAYLGSFTLSGVAGYEHVDGGTKSIGDDVEKPRRGGSFFDYADVSYYVNDDWKVSVGHRYTGGNNAAAFGTEFKLPVETVDASAFAEGRVGERDYKAVWGGVKIYLGADPKSLKDRQRASDPTNWLKDDMFSVSTSKLNGGSVPPPPPPP